MMTDTRIYGYLTDGEIVCPACYRPDDDGLPGDDGVRPVYSLDDDSNGWSCGYCGGWVFEPYLTLEGEANGLDFVSSRDGSYDDLVGDTVDLTVDGVDHDGVELVPVECDYGLAVGAHVDGRLVAVWATPDNPGRWFG
jgi:hypothetical protein